MHPVRTSGPRMVSVGWTRVRVDVRVGESPRRPLVLLNGVGASLEVLQPLVDALGPDLTTIRIDIPGTGESPPLSLPYTMAQMASLVDIVLGQVTSEPVDLLGYSWGGSLAQQIALQFPRRYRRLVLISASPGAISVPGTTAGLSAISMPRRFDDPDEMAVLSAQLGGSRAIDRSASDTGSTAASTSAAASPMRSESPIRAAATTVGYLQQLAALAWWSSLPFLPLLTQPVLLISGDDDPIVPAANTTLIGRLVPDATAHLIPGGHTEVITSAAEIAQLVNGFLDRADRVDRQRT